MKSARGVLISITGGDALTLFEVGEAANRIRKEVDDDANIIVGATVEPALHDVVRVSVVATGVEMTNSQIVTMSDRPPAEPVSHLTLAAESVEPAPVELSALQAHAPVAVKDVETEPLSAPVIPFPAPIERRNPIRRRSLLERLGVTASETQSPPRVSGWQ
jgi:cell division protein FtsZ